MLSVKPHKNVGTSIHFLCLNNERLYLGALVSPDLLSVFSQRTEEQTDVWYNGLVINIS